MLGTKDNSITYEHGDAIRVHGQVVMNGAAESFVDTSFAEDLSTRNSAPGYVTLKNNGAMTWGSKGQGKVALSSSGAELRVLAKCMRECKWI